MSSKYFGGINGLNDFSKNFVNFDTIADVFTATQKQLGQTPIFIEELSREELENKPEENNQKHSCTSCGTCPHKCKEDKPVESEEDRWRFNGYGNDVAEDEDEIYICEMCSALGYRQKYKPEICDTCTICETCAEYLEEECSGCSYSVYRDGHYFRERLKDEDIFDEDEMELFNSIKTDKTGGRLYDKSGFSITKI